MVVPLTGTPYVVNKSSLGKPSANRNSEIIQAEWSNGKVKIATLSVYMNHRAVYKEYLWAANRSHKKYSYAQKFCVGKSLSPVS